MTTRDNYKQFLERRESDNKKQADEFAVQLSRISDKLSLKFPDYERKIASQAAAASNFANNLYPKYRQLELDFFEATYGRYNGALLGIDSNWDRFVRNEAEETDDDRFLEMHTSFQAQRADAANDYWEYFINTGSTKALIDYLTAGGEINHIVRSAIVDAIAPESKMASMQRYETVLAVLRILNDRDHKISVSAACMSLAEVEFPNDGNQDFEDRRESEARKYRRHIRQFEKDTGFKFKRD